MTESSGHVLETPPRGKIGKQIQLPFSKAVEISLKSLRVRFWRSMLTVSLIILAIAFLTFVWGSSRLGSAVAIGMRPDAKAAADVGRAVDGYWKPFEQELVRRFSKRRVDYQENLEKLFAGNTGAFKAFCAEVKDQKDESKKVDLTGLPYEPDAIAPLAQKAREIGLEPDLEGWPGEPLRLCGIKGPVQARMDRMGALQLALQRQGIEPETPTEELKKMAPTTLWLITISLLVCGVGIANAMLMSVAERFREIGTMKCLGALDGFIVKLFFLESTFQGVAGTVLGVFSGFAFMMFFSLWAFGTATFHYFPVKPMLLIVLYAMVIGAVLSIIAAVFPALRAARMAPVEAMRVEE